MSFLQACLDCSFIVDERGNLYACGANTANKLGIEVAVKLQGEDENANNSVVKHAREVQKNAFLAVILRRALHRPLHACQLPSKSHSTLHRTNRFLRNAYDFMHGFG